MTGTDASNYRKTVTDSGIRIVTEHMDNVRSAALGIWFEAGSRDETIKQAGLSHFLEHMMFKGTEKRSALEIARSIEQVGGHLNAFTSKEITAYYAHLLDEHLPLAVDVLSDIVSNSVFADEEIVKEKGVILEEIASSDDTPEDVVHDDFSRTIFPDHSLGRPVLGTRESVSSFTHDDLAGYWRSKYATNRVVVAASGNIEHDAVVDLVNKNLVLSRKKERVRENPDPVIRSERQFERRKDIMQSHLLMGTRGISFGDDRRFALIVLNTILGSGMSSRLFQSVREQHGLVYTIYSFHEAYGDSGMWGVYAATEEKQISKAISLIREELDQLVKTPLTMEEIERTKAQVKGNIVLGLESASARMHRLARTELFLERFVPIDDLIKFIDDVTVEEVSSLAQELFANDFWTACLYPSNSHTTE